MPVNDHPLHRRLKAARVLGGFEGAKDLADDLAEKGYRIGERLIYAFESPKDKREPNQGQKDAIANACGLPREFFTVDLQRLPEMAVFISNDAREVPIRSLDDDGNVTGERVITITPAAQIRDQLQATLSLLEQMMERTTTPLEESDVPQPPGELGRRARGEAPTPEPQTQDGKQEAAGKQEVGG